MPLSKEAFRAQFNTRVDVSDILHLLRPLETDPVLHGYQMFRALEKVLLKDEHGHYYMIT
jgi:hypothetical protein